MSSNTFTTTESPVHGAPTPTGVAPDAQPYTYSHYTPTEDEDYYTTAVPSSNASHDRMGMLIYVHGMVEDLPETCETFTKSNLLRKAGDEDTHANAITRDMIHLLGSWHVPETFTGHRTSHCGQRYVNPNYPQKWRYSDVYTACECGAITTCVQSQPGWGQSFDHQTEHADDCHRIDKWRAKAEFWENRREAMIEQLYYGHNTMEAADRLGYSSGSLRPDAAHDHRVDHLELIDEAKERIVTTAAMNLHLHSPRDMAPAFGRSESWLTKELRERGIDLGEMYSLRRDLGTAYTDPTNND